jgi:hypothetical protein
MNTNPDIIRGLVGVVIGRVFVISVVDEDVVIIDDIIEVVVFDVTMRITESCTMFPFSSLNTIV